MGWDSINLFFSKDVYRRFLFFLLTLCARSLALADVFEKNELENETASVYRLGLAQSVEPLTGGRRFDPQTGQVYTWVLT